MLSDWTLDPLAATALVVVGHLYLRGSRNSRAPAPGLPAAAFSVGWVLLAVALMSPLHTAAESRLWAHMTQHMLLLAAPALLVAGRAGTRLAQGLDPPLRGKLVSALRRVFDPLTAPAVAWGLFVVTVVGWHVPPVFEAAAASPPLHALEHLSLVAAGVLYWASLFEVRRRRFAGAGLISLFSLLLVGTALGSILTLATVPLYPTYAQAAAAAGLDWITDQQLAGVIMWVPMGALIVPAMLTLAWRALRRAESSPVELVEGRRR